MSDRTKFGPPRYATREIAETLNPVLHNELWLMMEMLCNHRCEKSVDWLQVFELSPSQNDCHFNQAITHRQEQPPYTASNLVHVDSKVTAKIFIIDDGDHCTILYAHEY